MLVGWRCSSIHHFTDSPFHHFASSPFHQNSTNPGRIGHHFAGLRQHPVSTLGTTPSVTRLEISMLPTRSLPPHLAAAALSCMVLAPPRATPAQMYAPPSAPVVVSTEWLAKHLNDPKLVLLHVGERKEYDAGHIPGARYVKLDDISVSSHDHDNGLMLEMPQPDSLRVRLEALGISNDSRVIVYYGNDWVSPATRVIFTLDYAGLGASSALLDGGMPAWKAEKRALTTVAPKQAAGQLAALHVNPIVVDAAWVRKRLGTPNFHLIDGRAAVFYDGVEMGGSRKGHIAGAKSLPYTEIADDNLRLRSPDALRALFARAGVGPGDTVVAYCHIGQQATAVLFAARSIGHPVLLYDGSYQDWSRRPDFPVEDPRAGKASAQ
jgi:thiosulfate/3-mercaptopyruvate sulfurtransferase